MVQVGRQLLAVQAAMVDAEQGLVSARVQVLALAQVGLALVVGGRVLVAVAQAQQGARRVLVAVEPERAEAAMVAVAQEPEVVALVRAVAVLMQVVAQV
jgi:hypothetical protein